jgi:hypothetical protein
LASRFSIRGKQNRDLPGRWRITGLANPLYALARYRNLNRGNARTVACGM